MHCCNWQWWCINEVSCKHILWWFRILVHRVSSTLERLRNVPTRIASRFRNPDVERYVATDPCNVHVVHFVC
jgi:hypothetical protein